MKTDKERRPPQLSTPHHKNAKKRTWLFPTLLVGVITVLIALAALLALTTPALASISRVISPPAPTQEILWAPVDIAKPSVQRINVSVPAAPLSSPADSPGLSETEASTVVSEATETPDTLIMEIVSDDSMSQSIAIDNAQVQYSAEGYCGEFVPRFDWCGRNADSDGYVQDLDQGTHSRHVWTGLLPSRCALRDVFLRRLRSARHLLA